MTGSLITRFFDILNLTDFCFLLLRERQDAAALPHAHSRSCLGAGFKEIVPENQLSNVSENNAVWHPLANLQVADCR